MCFFRDGKFLLEAGGILRLCIGHCFATHAWRPLCGFFCAGKCLLEAGGILSLFKYSWTVGLQIVSLGTHGLYYLFPFVGKLLLEAVGILSLSNYC